MITFTDRLNARVAASSFGRWFALEGSSHPDPRPGSRFTTELRGGVTTWAAMAYILSVNAAVLAASGGPCDSGLLQSNPGEYADCQAEVQRELVTATAASAALASVLMGVFANLPVGMAPGLGLNAYFAYAIVGVQGSGNTSYGEALAAVFLEGWIFFALSLLGLRQWLARAMPHSLIMAVGAGIGIFIAFIGLSSGGLFVIGGDTTNLVGLGGCDTDDFLSGLPYFCAKRVLRAPTTWLGIGLGGVLTVFLMLYRVRGALLIGIALTTFASWPRGTSVSYFPFTPDGDARFAFFSQGVALTPLRRVGWAIDWNSFATGRVWSALFALLFVDLLDTTGTLYAMAKFASLPMSSPSSPSTRSSPFPRARTAFCIDALSISAGALLGTSPVTAFVESATGIAEGARTGLAAVTTGLCFLACVWLAPIFASVPPWATGGALVVVGSLMVRNVREVGWEYPGDAIPAFLTLVMIPLTYNIAYGTLTGLAAYVLFNGAPALLHKVSRGWVPRPPGADRGERWDWEAPSSWVPSWMKFIRRGTRSGVRAGQVEQRDVEQTNAVVPDSPSVYSTGGESAEKVHDANTDAEYPLPAHRALVLSAFPHVGFDEDLMDRRYPDNLSLPSSSSFAFIHPNSSGPSLRSATPLASPPNAQTGTGWPSLARYQHAARTREWAEPEIVR